VKNLKNKLRWLIALVCILYFVIFFYKNQDSLQIAFSISISAILYILILQFISYLLTILRFKIVLEKCSQKKLKFLLWTKTYILGRFLNTIIPQSGNLYRGVFLKKNSDISYTRYITAFSSFAWMDTILNLLCAFVVVAALEPGFKIGTFTGWKLLAITILILLLVPILLEVIFRKIHFKNQYINWLHLKLSETLTVSVNNLKDKTYMLKIVIIGITMFVRTSLAFYVYFSIFDINVTLPVLLVFSALFKLSTFIVLTPSNLGVQELAYGFLSRQVGIGMAQGVILSAFIRVIAVSIVLILGSALGGIDLLRHREEFTKSQK